MPTEFGLRPGAKAPDEPPSPTGYAPPLDSTARIDDVNRRFDDVDRRFDDLSASVNRRFDQVRADIRALRADHVRFDERLRAVEVAFGEVDQ